MFRLITSTEFETLKRVFPVLLLGYYPLSLRLTLSFAA